MNLRWLLFDHVDPSLGMSHAQRRKIRAAAWKRFHGGSRMVCRHVKVHWLPRIIAPLLPGAIGLIAVSLLFAKPLKSPWDVAWMIALQLLLTWIAMGLIAKWTWRPAVLSTLREAGYDVCLHCGYWLRGLGDDVKQCPECGTHRLPIERRLLSKEELADRDTVLLMQKLGNAVCLNCGVMWHEGSALHPHCPDCGSPRGPMPTEDRP